MSIVYVDQIEGLLTGLKATLVEKGQSQAALARASSVSQKHISQVLTGKADCSLTMLDRLIRTADSLPSVYLSGEEDL